MILSISCAVLFIFIVVAIIGITDEDSETLGIGILGIILTILLGFLLFGSTIPVHSQSTTQQFSDYDLSFNRNGAYLVLENGKTFAPTEFKQVEWLKTQPEVITVKVLRNSYGGELSSEIQYPE